MSTSKNEIVPLYIYIYIYIYISIMFCSQMCLLSDHFSLNFAVIFFLFTGFIDNVHMCI